MQRDSDNDINEVGGKEDDHILKIKGNNKKKKKSHSRVPVIVPIASTSMDTTGKVDVKRPKKTAQFGQEPSDNSTTTENANKPEESFASARKRKQTPASFHYTSEPESPKVPAWSRVFHVTPTGAADQADNSQAPPSTMERYLNEQFRAWSTHSDAGDTVHFPYVPPTQKTWSHSAGPLSPPLSTFSMFDSKLKHSKPSSEGGEGRPWSRGMTEDEDEMTPLRHMGYGKNRVDKSEKKRRVVEKDGATNVRYKNISERRRRYISDFYTTLVDSSWPVTLLLFAMSFFVTWLFFGSLYYLICWHHGDFDPDHLPSNQSTSGWKPCIWEIEDFSSCYLFSLETQHTIGYGSRQTTNLCPSAMITVSFQSIVGCLIQAFMLGLVFAKLSRPSQRSRTVVFSKQAVVCERNRRLCLLFRMGDLRDDSFIVNSQLSVKVIRRKVTEEGEMFHDIMPIKVTPDSSSEPCVFLIWPVTLVHEIDETSPFFHHSAADLMRDKFEISIVLEGTIESTSMNFQARTSYLPHEIFWGHRFEPMMLYRRDHNKYQVNFSAFHSTYEVDTPLCSSFELDQYYKARDQLHQRKSTVNMNSNTLPIPSKKLTPAPALQQNVLGQVPQQYNYTVGSATSGSVSSSSSDGSSEGSPEQETSENTKTDLTNMV